MHDPPLSSDIVLRLAFAPSQRPAKRTTISDVYRTSICSTGDIVAVKSWRRGDITDDEFNVLNRSLKETITALLDIRHRYLLDYLGLFELDGALCIVTPWVAEGNIKTYLARTRGADRPTILAQVASALAYLHSRQPQIVHGDLHPGNVLVAPDGRAILADFGLSPVIPPSDDLSISIPAMDGPHQRLTYRAPELLHSTAIPTPSSDVFAYGILGWEIYSGARPFSEVSASRAAMALRRGARPHRRQIARDDLTPEVWLLISHCWSQRPAARPTMKSVYARLTGPGYESPSLWDRFVALLYGISVYVPFHKL